MRRCETSSRSEDHRHRGEDTNASADEAGISETDEGVQRRRLDQRVPDFGVAGWKGEALLPNVELIYDADCPNVETARKQLRHALGEVGAVAQWQEWDRSDPTSPPYVRQYGSPTILVDGKDVAGARPSDEADGCRIYRNETGQIQGIPPSETIASALRGSSALPKTGSSSGWRTWLAVVPAVGVSLLPKLACPAFWPAYAGLLSAVGLGFLTDTAYPAAIDGRVSHHRRRGAGIPGQPTKGLRTVCFGHVGSTGRPDWQIRVRVRPSDVRRNWPAGRCIFLELVAE